MMMGTGLFAEPTFEGVYSRPSQMVVGLVTQPDRPGLAGTRFHAPDRSRHEDHRGARTQRARSSAREHQHARSCLAALTELKPDLLVVAAYGQILSQRCTRGPGAARRYQRPCVAAAEVSWSRSDRVGHLSRRNEHGRHDHPHDDRPRRRRYARSGDRSKSALTK